MDASYIGKINRGIPPARPGEFAVPTVGPLLFRALLSEDMYLAGTLVLLLSFLTIIGTLISDILLVMLDPRIRMERSSSRG